MTADRHASARRSFLRTSLLGAAVVTVGSGTAALTAGAADAAPIPAKPTRPKLPSSWKNTVFTAPLPGQTQGYIASFGTLFGDGAIGSLSASKLRRKEGIANFTKYGDSSGQESFTPTVRAGVVLDAASTPVTFVGTRRSRIRGHVQLVRTANPKRRALLVRVDGRSSTMRRLPKRVPIVSTLESIDTPEQLTPAMVRSSLAEAIMLSFSEDGEGRIPLTVDQIKLMDKGAHVSARVRGTIHGTRVDGTWYGAAQGGEGGWRYLYGKLPA